jgi:glycosyltransferase involved in cell wall biosynthesis
MTSLSADAAPGADLAALTATLRARLASYAEKPAAGEQLAVLEATRRELAAAVAETTPAARTARLAVVSEWLRLWAESGAMDLPVSGELIAAADALRAKGGAGLLAAMLLVPAWRWPGAPALRDVPAWLRGEFARYVFRPVQGFCATGDAEAFAAHQLRRLEELVALGAGPRPDPDFASTLGGYLAVSNCIPLYFSADPLRRHYELRGRLLHAALRVGRQPDLPARPRAGRRLRVGFINRHFGSQTETYTTLPTFERLDPARFEVHLFAHRFGDSELERHARAAAAAVHVFPDGLAAQVELLRRADLDVAVFGTNVTAVINEVTQLALHRVAPLQVVNNSSCTTSGLREIDLYVSGTATEAPDAPVHFSERLGLVGGPAHAFNYAVDAQPPTKPWTRAEWGIPADAVLFVSAANYFKVIPEMRVAWARLLAAVPGSRLLLHPFNPNWSSRYPIRRFRAEFDAVLAAHGVAAERLVISAEKFPTRADVKALLALGDVYLDTFPFGGVNSLVDPLENGTPTIAWEGNTFRSRMGAALLRALDLGDLAVGNAAAYHALAVGLATDPARRADLRGRIVEAMERAPVFLDTLAASDAFGALLEQAHDELLRVGREAFRRDRTPIMAADVATAAYRRARAEALLAEGRPEAALVYFLGAIDLAEPDAALWHGAATALLAAGRREEAVQALEACLRIDARSTAGWLLLAELALGSRHVELLNDAAKMLRLLAPDDPRRAEIERRGAELPGFSGAEATKRILIYSDDPQHGGVAQYNHSLLEGLVAAGYTALGAQTRCESPLVQRQRELGVEHHWIPYDTKSEFTRSLTDIATSARVLEAARPDLVVFSDCCPLSNLAAREAALAAGIPYVAVVGFVGAYLADRFKDRLPQLARQYALARAVVAVSQENLGLLRDRFGLEATAGQVIHYGRPERFFAPRDEAVRARLRAELGLPADAVLCLTTARLAAAKGYPHLLAAAQRAVAVPAGAKLHFVWCGDGELRGQLEHSVAAAGLVGRVHLLGHRWDVADWYDAADIFVLPSELEGMPLAIMEAMAKGLPVAATAVSGIPEELGDTGCLLPAPAAGRTVLIDALVRTLLAWAADPALRARTGDAGRTRAETMFREALMIERTVGLVGRALGAPQPEAAACAP